MESKRCSACMGSGKIMGGGMIFKDCPECGGVGKILPKEPVKATIDKTSPHYKQAIKELRAKGLKQKEAEKVFQEEFERQEKSQK
jgi:DnaJ-class molecular chaperone